jgi:uncharacterized ferredoxin-like protein
LTQNKAKFLKKLIITLVFKKNANFFAKNWEKIAKNCDHNIDPRADAFVLLQPECLIQVEITTSSKISLTLLSNKNQRRL